MLALLYAVWEQLSFGVQALHLSGVLEFTKLSRFIVDSLLKICDLG